MVKIALFRYKIQMILLKPWFWSQSWSSYGRMYNRIGSFDFAIKLKITPKNSMPGFGTIYRATLLISRPTKQPTYVTTEIAFLKKKSINVVDKYGRKTSICLFLCKIIYINSLYKNLWNWYVYYSSKCFQIYKLHSFCDAW